jgi:uncharacterized SAM-binding protein YcdF (DUF218 family)
VIYLIPLHIKLSRAAALTSTAGAYLSVFFLGVATGQMLAGILINWSGGRPWNLLVLPGAINIVVLLLIRSRWKGNVDQKIRHCLLSATKPVQVLIILMNGIYL